MSIRQRIILALVALAFSGIGYVYTLERNLNHVRVGQDAAQSVEWSAGDVGRLVSETADDLWIVLRLGVCLAVLALPVLVIAFFYFLVWLFRTRAERRVRASRDDPCCSFCSYQLLDEQIRCPECGRARCSQTWIKRRAARVASLGPRVVLSLAMVCAAWLAGVTVGATVRLHLDAVDAVAFTAEVSDAQQSGEMEYSRRARQRFRSSAPFGLDSDYWTIWHWSSSQGYWNEYEQGVR